LMVLEVDHQDSDGPPLGGLGPLGGQCSDVVANVGVNIAYLSFNVDSPSRHSNMVMIQKRTTTWVSVHPLFSK
jgi:hypothetical protein